MFREFNITNQPSQSSKTSTVPSTPLKVIEYKNAIFYGDVDDRGNPHNVGIFIYDNGDFAVYGLFQGKIDGNYFYFDCSKKGACYYGSMKNNKLHGTNFAYARKNAFIKVQFQNGTPRNQDYTMKSKFKSFVFKQKDQRVQRFSIEAANFIKPTDFLMEFFGVEVGESFSFLSKSKSYDHCFQIYELKEDHFYFGTIFQQKPHGYGIVFQNQWPVCYGKFQQGKLKGLGRVYESPLMVADGYFIDSNISGGWLINFKEGKTSYGRRQGEKSKFKIIQEFNGIHHDKIEAFRKNCHLKSLFYSNNYAIHPTPQRMWPKQLLNQILYEEVIQDILHNFNPSHISEIDRIPEETDHGVEQELVELIQDHNKHKKSHAQISKILESRLKQYQNQNEQTIKKPMAGDRKLFTEDKPYITPQKKLDLHKIYSTYLKKK